MADGQSSNSPHSLGITKLALLNTAGYDRCVIPLDRPVSICAPNNTGKSSLINALQFPLITDLRLTEWDGHTIAETRKFYFRTDRTYILLEAEPEAGNKVVIGVAGLGPASGYEHQFFCFNGPLDLSLFSDDDGQIRPYAQLSRVLEARGSKLVEPRPHELMALLTGAITRFDADIRLRMIPLKKPSEGNVFREILRRVLNLDKLTASDVKLLLLKVFDRQLGATPVDFAAKWQEAFAGVSRDRAHLRALESQGEAINALATMSEQAALLRGKIIAHQGPLDSALIAWADWFEAEQERLAGELAGLDDAHQQQRQQLADLGRAREQLARRDADLERFFADWRRLEQAFALAERSTLVHNRDAIQQEYESLAAALAAAQGQSLDSLLRRRRELEQQRSQLQRQLAHYQNNLFSRLREELPLNDVMRLSRALNPALLALAVGKKGEVQLSDEAAFAATVEQLADCFHGDELRLPGVTIDLKGLQPADEFHAHDRATLQQRESELSREIERLQAQEKVARDFEGQKALKEALYQQLQEAEEAIRQYDRYQQIQQDLPRWRSQQEQLDAEREQLDQQQEQISSEQARHADRRLLLRQQLATREQQKAQLERAKNERLDERLALDGPITPYPFSVNPDLATLASALDDYNRDCRALRDLGLNLSNTYRAVVAAGVTRFEVQRDPQLRLTKLVNAWQHLDQEREAVARASRVALTEVANLMARLLTSLDQLERLMRDFNRGITRQPISNLKDFRIEIVPRPLITGHIRTLVDTSLKYDSGETLDLLLGHGSFSEDEVSAAKDYLVQAGSKEGGLALADLFDIRFRVIDRDGSEALFDRIDGAGSNGTRITIKLLTGMLFIRHLLAEPGRYRIPIYIDEAADIDPANQQAIISCAMQFGLVPVFASVKPQTACHYIVPIRTHASLKVNRVEEQDWIICEPLSDAQPAAAAEVALAEAD